MIFTLPCSWRRNRATVCGDVAAFFASHGGLRRKNASNAPATSLPQAAHTSRKRAAVGQAAPLSQRCTTLLW
jgi:hypothetical protein